MLSMPRDGISAQPGQDAGRDSPRRTHLRLMALPRWELPAHTLYKGPETQPRAGL